MKNAPICLCRLNLFRGEIWEKMNLRPENKSLLILFNFSEWKIKNAEASHKSFKHIFHVPECFSLQLLLNNFVSVEI